MPQTATLTLENKIVASLTNAANYLWFPHLTSDLAKTGWQRLEKKTGITVLNYGTARVILGNPIAPQNAVFTLLFREKYDNIKHIISIEILPEEITESYKESGISFYTADEICSSEIINCLSNAFNIIKKIPSLFATVVSLVKSIHLIKPKADDYDVSFSEPYIPFSIFVSLPRQNSEINDLRVAEAIIHEAMHLQLTLIEQLVPITVDTDKKYFSPWKNEYRSPQGVLHALYVFRVIDCFLKNLLTNDGISIDKTNYIKQRHSTISEQIHSIKSFINCPSLTKTTSNFVNTLIFTHA